MNTSSISCPGQAGIPLNPSQTRFKEILSGENAFYRQADYDETTKKEMKAKEALPTAYVWNTESKVKRVAKILLSIIIFPIGVYELIHTLVGKIVMLPASTPSLVRYSREQVERDRSKLSSCARGWKVKRLTIEVDATKIDAVIIGKKKNLANGRWLLASQGNGQFYESELGSYGSPIGPLLEGLNANGIVFNYPGVGASSGLPSRKSMEKAYRAMLAFLADKEQGIAAKEIIGYGHSIGGGVQAEAIKDGSLAKGVKYVFVKSRTFSDVSATASFLTNRLNGFLVKIFGWNISTVESSKNLKVPEIIMQTADVVTYEGLKDSKKIKDDGLIAAEASCAKALLDDKSCPRHNKLFIGIPERHNESLHDASFFVEKIEAFLQDPSAVYAG